MVTLNNWLPDIYEEKAVKIVPEPLLKMSQKDDTFQGVV